MVVKSRVLEEKPSEPIDNIIQSEEGGYARYSAEYLCLTQKVRLTKIKSIDLHKAKLGRQDFVFVGEFRQFVWDRLDTLGWRVFVAIGKGISFEVRPDFTPEQAWAAWESYQEALGLGPDRLEDHASRQRTDPVWSWRSPV